MDNINFRPAEFAAAYIQTLPHASKPDEFESREDFIDYMERRLELYFEHFVDAAFYADNRSKDNLDNEN